MLCYRLADSAIDIYGMMCVLSRASKALTEKTPEAQHEAMLAKLWCNDASIRVAYNCASLSKQSTLVSDDLRKNIASDLVNKTEVAAGGALGF